MSSEIQTLVEKSRIALEGMLKCTQEQVDAMCKGIAHAIADQAEELARQAVAETGMGNVADKIQKNLDIGLGVWTTMKHKKSVGIIDEDKEKGIIFVAHPKGVIGCIAPTTNPSLTSLGNAMLAIKGRNTCIVSPHPRSKDVTIATVEIMNAALSKMGAPENVIQVITAPSTAATQELMRSVDVVVATGGMAMVNAAYSSGKPAYGVGQGNVQALIGDDYEDFAKAAADIVNSRAFDNGVICAGEQCIIVHKKHERKMIEALVANNAYFSADKTFIEKIKAVVFEDGHMAKDIVGKDALTIAEMAGVSVPENAKAIVLKVDRHGPEEILCSEKLCPVLALLTYDTFEDGVQIARENLLYQGAGHTATIHTNKREYVEAAGLRLPVCRVMVNLPGVSATGAGLFSHLNPTPSIGCGSWGNNSISENLLFSHLIDVTQVVLPRQGPPPSAEQIWAD